MTKFLKKGLLLILTMAVVIASYVIPVGAETAPFAVRELSRYTLEENIYFSGAKPGWTVDSMLTDFTSEDSYEVYNGNDKLVTEQENVRTGLALKNVTQNAECTIVLKGDINGDGRIGTIDYVRVKKYFTDILNLSGASLNAADIDGDGSVKASDYMLIKNYLRGEDIYLKTPDIEFSYVDFTEVKNVILMIGDGMGPTHIEVAREKTGGNIDGKFYMDYFPNNGYEKTYSLDGVTDSAAAGTALATGYKTYNGAIGLDINRNELQNIRELCASLGMKTGVVTTKVATDATPASFSAHAEGRGLTSEIAKDQLMNMPDVLVGFIDYTYNTMLRDSEVSAVYSTYDITRAVKHKALYRAETEKIFGNLNEFVDLPAVTEKTLHHLEKQDTEDKGFFVMIEGAKIDTYSHSNDLDGMVKELDEFDEAIGVAMDYVRNNPDTILIVTSDHETGGLQPDGSYTTGGHTGTDCRVMALGYGTEVFDGKTVNNTDIPKFIAKSLGVDNFGDQDTGYMVENTTKVTYYDSDQTQVLSVAAPSAEVKGMQGGYTDGQYYYQAFIQTDAASDEENNIVNIVKSDFATGEVVKVSENLSLNHANDITLNTKTNQLIVCHNNPNRKVISFLDPESLEVTGTKTLSRKIFSIDYNEIRDCYVVGISGGQKFAILDSDFNEIAGPFTPTVLTEGYTTQGVACDDSYICFVLYSFNVITVYDWGGNFVAVIKLSDITDEPENISIVDGTVYVGVATSTGMKAYKVENYRSKSIDVFLPQISD